MYKKVGFLVVVIAVIAGCKQSDEQIVRSAYATYDIMQARYQDISTSVTDEEIFESSREIAEDTSFGLWDMLACDYALFNSGSVPLHKARYIMDKDIYQIEKRLNQLDSRALRVMPIYEKLRLLSENISYTLRVIRSSSAYIAEAQFIEQRRLQKEQIAQTQAQTEALQKIANKPVVVEEKVIVREERHSKPRCELIQEEIYIPSSKPEKKIEVIIKDSKHSSSKKPTRHVII